MALNFRKFLEGLRIVPKTSSTASEKGDLDVSYTSIQFAPAAVNISTEVITINSHGFSNNDIVNFSSSGTLPSPLVSSTNYYIISATANTFQVSLSSGGSAENLSSQGTGTHTIVRPSTGVLNYHNGSSSSPIVTESHSANLSNKTIDTANSNTVKVNGNTLSASAGTATVTIPNSTDTLVGRATSDTLTNKTIDGDDNTIQDIGIASLKTVLADANKVVRRDAAGVVTSGNTLPNSSEIVTIDSSATLTNKTIDGDNNTIQDVGISSLKTVLADANKVIRRDAAGAVTSGNAIPNSSEIVTTDSSSTFTNKTFNAEGTGNSLSNITNTNIKSTAAIDRSKLASGSANHVIINDGTGVLSSEATLAISRGGTGAGNKTDAFDALAPTTTAGDFIVHNGTDNVRQGIGSDGQVLVVDTTQTNKLKWTNLQQGAKNYITYGTFENGATTGWSLSHSTLDATTKLPNQASGSWTSATSLAISAISSGQLAGSYSLQLSGTAATTAGDMLVTDALTLDLEAQASVQTFSFFYKVTGNGTGTPNFSGTSSNAIGVAIYDVTNGAWIQPAGVFNIVQSSGVGKSSGTFQVPSNCTSVRLAVYFPNSTAASGGSPFTVVFDDFVLGPQVVQYGAPVTDWQSYTPTFGGGGFGTPTSVGFKYRRVGSKIEVRGTFTTGTVAASAGTISLPSGYAIDETQTVGPTISGSVRGVVGRWVRSNSSASSVKWGTVAFAGSAQTTVTFTNSDYTTALSPFSPPNINAILVNTDQIDVEFEFTAVGLSSSVSMSNDTDTRVVAFNGSFIATSIPTGTLDTAKIIAPGVSQDTHGAYAAGLGAYTVPVSGFYRITHQNSLSLEVARIFRVGYTINSTTGFTRGTSLTNSGATFTITGIATCTGIEKLNAGDVIRFAVAHDNVAATLLTNDARFQVYTIERLSGPATIAASETVAAHYRRTTADGNQSLSSGSSVVYFTGYYPSKVVDTHNFVTSSASDTYATIPVSGVYEIVLTNRLDTSAGTETFQSYIMSGGTNQTGTLTIDGTQLAACITQLNTVGTSGTAVYCGRFNAGDIVRFKMLRYAAVTTLLIGANFSGFTIKRVGN